MLGQVGDDGFGKDYFEALGREGIDAQGVGFPRSSKQDEVSRSTDFFDFVGPQVEGRENRSDEHCC